MALLYSPILNVTRETIPNSRIVRGGAPTVNDSSVCALHLFQSGLTGFFANLPAKTQNVASLNSVTIV